MLLVIVPVTLLATSEHSNIRKQTNADSSATTINEPSHPCLPACLPACVAMSLPWSTWLSVSKSSLVGLLPMSIDKSDLCHRNPAHAAGDDELEAAVLLHRGLRGGLRRRSRLPSARSEPSRSRRRRLPRCLPRSSSSRSGSSRYSVEERLDRLTSGFSLLSRNCNQPPGAFVA